MKKNFFFSLRGIRGPPKPPKNAKQGVLGAPEHPKKINFFLLILHFFGYLSFPKLFYFLSLDRWKAFYDFFSEKSFFSVNIQFRGCPKPLKLQMSGPSSISLKNSPNFFWQLRTSNRQTQGVVVLKKSYFYFFGTPYCT